MTLIALMLYKPLLLGHTSTLATITVVCSTGVHTPCMHACSIWFHGARRNRELCLGVLHKKEAIYIYTL